MILRALAASCTQCLTSIQALPDGTAGVVDNNGMPVYFSSTATAVTYSLCKETCGKSACPFQWSVFSQQFSAWLLPWLALISQLPFGSRYRSDNLMSIVLTVGSPTLGAYSLALTVLNTQWIARRFSGFKYPNVGRAVRVMSSLQQVPLAISTEYGLLSSLVVLPENDEWWKEMVEGLNYIHTWSLAAGLSIVWVVVAFLFTVIGRSFHFDNGMLADQCGSFLDSFSNIPENAGASGQGVGLVWMWLLPIGNLNAVAIYSILSHLSLKSLGGSRYLQNVITIASLGHWIRPMK